ncbi:hypothetical protein ALP12_200380 [Pseudomonas savastanoi pv. phaseolicola]|uniref:hypothetical protein n=1 Tax=Pseudomonas savastanoi TaxID=29438 RepID=UPI0006B9B978|nr:hypothetical protein [Pseudomonas savastanoi]RMV27205.1 hypothetical protein ALP12_200380 [Pseudomonas savastanoi pv. phaseolicola]
MKIWAYAKGADGYVTLEDGRLKFFFVWQVLKMKRENPQQFSSLTFISTQWREKYRREMFAVRNGYFRYKSAEPANSRSGDSDGETLPHAYLIAVLSQLQTINFKIGDEVVPFTFTRLVAEETRLRFGNGNGYVPDLYGEFTSDNPYYRKWGGKVAIEVCYSNPCSRQKVIDFCDHGIPIIEIKVAKTTNIETYIDKNDIEGSIERGYQKITDIASNQLFCRVLSDPVRSKSFSTTKTKSSVTPLAFCFSTEKSFGLTTWKNRIPVTKNHAGNTSQSSKSALIGKGKSVTRRFGIP